MLPDLQFVTPRGKPLGGLGKKGEQFRRVPCMLIACLTVAKRRDGAARVEAEGRAMRRGRALEVWRSGHGRCWLREKSRSDCDKKCLSDA